MGQLSNGDIRAGSDVNVTEHGAGALVVLVLWQIHHEDARRGHVVNVQELAIGLAGAPDRDIRRLADLRFMEATQQRGNDVRVLGMIVVTGPIQIRRHDASVVHAMRVTVLPVVAFTCLDSGDLRNRIGFIGRFEQSR